MRRSLVPALSALLVAGLLGGCGVGTEAEPQPLGSGAATAAPDVLTTTGASRLYFVRDERLQAVSRRTPPDERARLAALLAGVGAGEAAAGLRNALPASLTLNDVRRTGTTLTVDLAGDLGEATAAEQTLAVAQIVFTATEQSGMGAVAPTAVRLLVDGSPVDVPRADGSLDSSELERADFRAQAPPEPLTQQEPATQDGEAPSVSVTPSPTSP